jgi:prepilin-type N-terminal cleavage/methylation domain-containing protein
MSMKYRTHTGFTLVETLVAVAILATSIVGPFVAIQTALKASYSARDQLVATMLAQEGIEYVRGVRDSNYLYNIKNPTLPQVSWLAGIDDSAGSTVNCVDPVPTDGTARRCVVDPTGSTPVRLCNSNGAGTCDQLNYVQSLRIYTQATPSGYVPSAFTRTMTLSKVGTAEMQVTVTVTFTSVRQGYTVTLTERLANWL